MDQKQQGQFIQADFFNNSGGLNLTDSPIRVLDEQATGGYNYEYSLKGGFKKRLGHTQLGSADAQLQTLGYASHIAYDNTKTLIRAAGRKLQTQVTTTGVCTNLAEDTLAVNSDFIPASQTIPSVFAQFNSADQQVLWQAGSNSTRINGIYNSSGFKVTQNGASPATGAFSATRAGAGAGVWAGTGTYFYAIVLRKASTLATSNAALDISATITVVTDKVTLNFAGLTGLDTTKYDQIWIYRSAVAGVTGFTTGDIVAKIASNTVSYDDTGTSLASAQNVPRAGNTILDNSVVPAGTYNALTTWKRRLVTAINSTIYLSDTNKPESWPLTNSIQIPSGGPITGLAVVSFSTQTSTSVDEFLCIFKEAEVWILTGSSFSDWSLKFIDRCGAVSQRTIVSANGYLSWFDYRGFYLWDGWGKPTYISRPIEFQFSPDGTLDKSKFNLAWGSFHKKSNQIVWYMSDSVLGEQCYSIKLDLRLTIPATEGAMEGRMADGVFLQDKTTFPLYGGSSVFPSYDETFYAGDASGKTYLLFDGTSDAGAGVAFTYDTKILDFGIPTQTKRIQKVIAWVEDSSDANLTLNYWNNYKTNPPDASSQSLPISKQVNRAIWDLGYWDSSFWDTNNRTYTPLVFNLYSPKGSEGEAFKLEFQQTDANAPVSIAGFSIIYTLAGLRS